MHQNIRIGDKVEADVIRFGGGHEKPKLTAHWEWEHIRNGKVIDCWGYDNFCSDEGLTNMLGVHFHADTQITAWFIELFESDTTPDGDTTYAVPVYTPTDAYDEATRPAYTEAAAAAKSITNSANKAVFTMNDTKAIYGASLVGGGAAEDTKKDVAGGGTLFSASQFGAVKNVVATDVLNVTITITLADS